MAAPPLPEAAQAQKIDEVLTLLRKLDERLQQLQRSQDAHAAVGVAAAQAAGERLAHEQEQLLRLTGGKEKVQLVPSKGEASGGPICRSRSAPSVPTAGPGNANNPAPILALASGALGGSAVRPTSSLASLESEVSFTNAPDAAFVAATLPLHWPQALDARQFTGDAGRHLASNTSWLAASPASSSDMLGELMSDRQAAMNPSRHAFDPNSIFHTVYDTMSVVVLMFDLTTIPYVLSWQLEYTGFLYWAAWFTVLFWTLDIAINFNTGFFHSGQLIMHSPTIARHYLSTFFVPDCLVLLCDWLNMAMDLLAQGGSSAKSLKMLRFAKLVRLLRIVSMLRMMRLFRLFEEFMEKHVSESFRLSFKIATLFVSIMWGNHMIACAWYAVGRSGPTDTGARWVTEALCWDVEAGFCMEKGPVYQYASSFHYAAAQVTLGGMDIHPTNSVERLLAIIALMIGFLFGSTVISVLSAAMVDFQMMTKDRNTKLAQVNNYLRQHNVEQRVALLVRKQAVERLGEKEDLSEDAVPALKLLSAALMQALRFAISRRHFDRHPLFRLWNRVDKRIMKDFSAKAARILPLRAKDDLFLPGVASESAYYLAGGRLRYNQEPQTSPVQEPTSEEVGQDAWLCEAALWSTWIHVGQAEAIAPSQVLTVGFRGLSEVTARSPTVKIVTREYAKQFYKRLRASRPPHAAWPSDLQVPFADYESLVLSMPRRVQATIGTHALDYLAAVQWKRYSEKRLKTLRQEVDSGKSIVVVNGDGQVLRVVSVVALRIRREAGGEGEAAEPRAMSRVLDGGTSELFAQLGKVEDGQLTPQCQLPGGKQQRDELPGEAAHRLFLSKLAPMVGRTEVVCTERRNVEMDSKEHGVRTKYLRTVVSVRFLGGGQLEAPRCVVAPCPGGGGPPEQWRLAAVRDVYAIGSPENAYLYAWVPEVDFDFLSSGGGEGELKRWLGCVSLPLHGEEGGPEVSSYVFAGDNEGRRRCSLLVDSQEVDYVSEEMDPAVPADGGRSSRGRGPSPGGVDGQPDVIDALFDTRSI